MAGLKIENITKKFSGAVTAVDNVSLDIPDGKFVILVGPSGCGKTTLLRLIAGLESASAGRLLIGERDVTRARPRDRDIAMVFQSYALYPHMSVRRNMSFALELKGLPKLEIESRIDKASSILGIGGLLDRQPRQLSGGQRQRVALGRAIVREPSVFLFDEPLSNLDAKLRTAMRSELIKLHNRLGTTIVYVTHDQVEAMTMGQLVVVMKDGVVQQSGEPLEIYRNPSNRFVAEFIGSPAMNFIPARIESHAGRSIAVSSAFSLALAAERTSVSDGQKVEIGIRPEQLRFAAKEDEATGTVLIDGVVEVVEPLGPETIVEVSAAGVNLVARIGGEWLPQIGARVTLAADERRFFLFDGQAGTRLC
ncbi:ABC transporter ATP-binding protein [Aestuariivirga sp.]|uniref:ABC transporter ATP-binding protein n=1 Tax=Aestuariivirga sp. TaxID=2650926 RepID=UPI00391D4CB5